MTLPPPVYDLMLLLDPQGEEAARAKIVADARSAIEAQGELTRHDEWGERPLAYPIEKKASAEYHLLQFHVGEPELLSGLTRTLQITDGVMRFRIIKLAPGVPEAPDMRSSAASPARRGDSDPTAPAPTDAPSAPAPADAPSAPAAADVPSEPPLAVAETA